VKVLVVNAGSSSVKYSLIDVDSSETMASGVVERIGCPGTRLKAKAADGRREERPTPGVRTAGEALETIATALTEGPAAVIRDMGEIDAAGHRVVQGADHFSEATLVDERLKGIIRDLFCLAPLHNPANYAGIEAAEDLLPGKPQVAVFDTAFHATMPPRAHLYGLPVEFARKHKLRRYGFHGTSHKYVSARAIEMLGSPGQLASGSAGARQNAGHSKIVTAHVGNGVSLAAVEDGESRDTTMGFTPLEGVVMGTRSGSIDAALVLHLVDHLGMSTKEVDRILNRESGMLGMAGVGSGDMRDVEEAVVAGNEAARLAFDVYCYRIAKAVGALAVALKGMDALVFTAGVGENSPLLRAAVAGWLPHLGVRIDGDKNEHCRPDCDISAAGSPCRVLVIGTQEDLLIARETARVACR
jgi:acetate kinase